MLLKTRSLAYEEIKIDDEAERMAFYEKCGPSVRQMPQIFINDQRVGGLAGLQAALAQLTTGPWLIWTCPPWLTVQ